jgi:DNA-binding transcriptional LysR family regulator
LERLVLPWVDRARAMRVDNPTLNIDEYYRNVISQVVAFYEISSHNDIMEIRHLRYFTTVAKELHFARAAEILNISAPTLSHQINALEAMLGGVKLFTRKTRTAVSLTHAGKRFLVEAEETLKHAAYAEMVGRQAARGLAGTVAIGYVLSAGCSGLVSSRLADYKADHPEVVFLISRTQTLAQFDALIAGDLDIGIARRPSRYPTGLAGFVVDRQPYVVVMPAKHPLAKRKTITRAMLADEPFIAGSPEMEIGFWSNLQAVAPPGVAPRIVERGPDAFSVLALVGAGAGMSVLSQSMSRIAMPGVVFRRISDVTEMAEHVAIFRKNESAPVVKHFLDFLRARSRAL